MPANLTFDALKKAVAAGEIDTVLVLHRRHAGPPDGQALSSRSIFVDSGWEETHCCNYLLAIDIEMVTVPGYKATSWETGLRRLRDEARPCDPAPLPWLPGTALVHVRPARPPHP